MDCLEQGTQETPRQSSWTALLSEKLLNLPPLRGPPVSLHETAKHMRETVITEHPSDTSSWLLAISSKIPVLGAPLTGNYWTFCPSKNVKQCSFNIFIVHNFKKYMSLIKYTCLVIFASSRKQILYFFFLFCFHFITFSFLIQLGQTYLHKATRTRIT